MRLGNVLLHKVGNFFFALLLLSTFLLRSSYNSEHEISWHVLSNTKMLFRNSLFHYPNFVRSDKFQIFVISTFMTTFPTIITDYRIMCWNAELNFFFVEFIFQLCIEITLCKKWFCFHFPFFFHSKNIKEEIKDTNHLKWISE